MLLPVLLVWACGPAQEEHVFPDANDPEYAASFDEPTDPRVSTSAGEDGGVVLLWPRVVPAADAESVAGPAADLQAHMQELVARVYPDRPLDVRPAPERACPNRGCQGIAFGALLAHRGQGCAVVAMVRRPGADQGTHLVPWTEGTGVRDAVIPFREPAESHVEVRDYRPCAEVIAALAGQDEAVAAALTAAGAD